MPQVDDFGAWNKPIKPGLKTAFPQPHTPIPGVTSPALPPSVPGQTSVKVGGSTPNYAELIQNSPAYVAWKASQQSRLGNLATDRASIIRRLALDYGGLPPGYTDAYGDLRPEDLAAASGNQFSAEHTLQQNYEKGVAAMHQSLAGRGMLQSGELGFGQGQADYAHGQAEYQTGNAFLDALNQAVSGYTTGVGNINAEEPGVISNAQANVQQLYPTVAPTDANYVSGSQEQYGFPVYDDGAGNLWKMGAGGTPEPFSAPTAATPPGAVASGGTPGTAATGQAPRTIVNRAPAQAIINMTGHGTSRNALLRRR